jgi:hypothetical protein
MERFSVHALTTHFTLSPHRPPSLHDAYYTPLILTFSPADLLLIVAAHTSDPHIWSSLTTLSPPAFITLPHSWPSPIVFSVSSHHSMAQSILSFSATTPPRHVVLTTNPYIVFTFDPHLLYTNSPPTLNVDSGHLLLLSFTNDHHH